MTEKGQAQPQSGSCIFATDMTTFGSTAEQLKGVVRFDLAGGGTQRFATEADRSHVAGAVGVPVAGDCVRQRARPGQ